MKIKIVSDGSEYGTRVIDADTGELIDGVVAVEIRADADMFGGAPRVKLHMTDVAVDVVSNMVDEMPAGVSRYFTNWVAKKDDPYP